MVVEPSSLALLECAKTGDRTAGAWQAVLQRFGNLEFVMSDAGLGIAAGVHAVQQERGEPTTLTQGLDVFHTAHEAQHRLGVQWRQAEAVWDQAAAATANVAAVKARGRDARSASVRATGLWLEAQRHLADVERAETAWHRLRAALSVFRPDGRLNERTWAAAEIAAALPALSGAEWKKLRNYVTDPRSLAFVDRMHRQLREAVPAAALRDACVRRWRLRHPRATAAPRVEPGPSITAMVDERIRTMELSRAEQQAYERVSTILATTVRASSAVEGINSVLRMQQSRHRKMTQGLLDLKRLYWNGRRLQTGPRRGRNPYEMLGVPLPSTDFWTLLQMPRTELQQRTQELSTQRVTE